MRRRILSENCAQTRVGRRSQLLSYAGGSDKYRVAEGEIIEIARMDRRVYRP